MNAPLFPKVFARATQTSPLELPAAAEEVLHDVWESRFGPMLIEIRDSKAFVNGEVVEPAELPMPAVSHVA